MECRRGASALMSLSGRASLRVFPFTCVLLLSLALHCYAPHRLSDWLSFMSRT